MEHLVIEGLRPYDGSYPLDLEGAPLTIREWGWIKKLSGYLPGTASDGFDEGDPELMLAIACILLRRAGKVRPEDVAGTFEGMADKPAGSLRWETVGVTEDVDEPDPTASSTESSSFSSPDSIESSASLDAPLRPTGTPDSDSSPSGLTTSVT